VVNNTGKPQPVTRLTTEVNSQSGNCGLVNPLETSVNKMTNARDPSIRRVLFSFCKEGSAVFHGHLSLVEIFSMAVTRSGLPVQYTQGFNPLAKIEIAAPLSTGVSAAAEIAAADFAADASFDGFTERLNAKLPEGIRIIQAADFHIPGGSKKHSLSSLLWGFGYGGKNGETVYVKAAEEKQFRSGAALFSLRRTGVLARNIAGPAAAGTEWASYFDVYRFLYPR
jgi:hypothetical protein